MSALMSLPSFYKIAALLGLEVEVYVANEWHDYKKFFINHDTPIRVLNGHEQLHAFIDSFFDKIMLDNYEYLVPKHVAIGDTVILQYFLGAYAKKQSNTSLVLLDFESTHELMKNKTLPFCQNVQSFFK